MRKILLVEDDKSIVMGLEFLLKQRYDLTVAFSKKEATEKLKQSYNLVILDVMLGDGSGFDLAEKIEETPIMFLTARDDEESVVKGLNFGEDYLTKPFRNQELLIRIEKIIARNTRDEIAVGNLVLDKSKKEFSHYGEIVQFTAIEYKILELLFVNKNKVVTREQILEAIWDIDANFVNDNTLTVNIKRIRSKLSFKCIKTIKGFGYMVEDV